MSENENFEYGRGLVNQLVRFAKHQNYYNIQDKLRGVKTDLDMKMIKEVFKNDEAKWLSDKIELWANGSSDHLYDIEIPEEWHDTKLEELINKLRNKGLEMGHGFTGKLWTKEDFWELQELMKKIAMEIDKKIGVPVSDGYD